MPALQAIHGRIVDLRRYTNVHLTYGRRPPGPTDRYELWLRTDDGDERQFTIHTRVMPARRGHAVSLIVTAQKEPQVMALANWTILDGVNFLRTEASPLVRAYDFLVLPAGILAAATAWGEPGLVLSVLGALVYLLITTTGRALIRIQRAHQVDRAIDAEARRTHNLYSKLGN